MTAVRITFLDFAKSLNFVMDDQYQLRWWYEGNDNGNNDFGDDGVIFPEEEMGKKVAQTLHSWRKYRES